MNLLHFLGYLQKGEGQSGLPPRFNCKLTRKIGLKRNHPRLFFFCLLTLPSGYCCKSSKQKLFYKHLLKVSPRLNIYFQPTVYIFKKLILLCNTWRIVTVSELYTNILKLVYFSSNKGMKLIEKNLFGIWLTGMCNTYWNLCGTWRLISIC